MMETGFLERNGLAPAPQGGASRMQESLREGACWAARKKICGPILQSQQKKEGSGNGSLPKKEVIFKAKRGAAYYLIKGA